MSDSYFLCPHAGGPALEIKPGFRGSETVSSQVLICTTPPDMHSPPAVLDPSQVEEVCRVMYRYAGLEWPGTFEPVACTTRFREGECAGTMGHPGDCSVKGDGIPGGWWRGVSPQHADDIPPAESGSATRARRHIDLLTALSDITGLLNEIRDRLPAPPPPVCGAPDSYDTHRCDQPVGHTDRHRQGITTWPNAQLPVCDQPDSSGRYRCSLLAGHTGRHSADTGGPFNVFTWPNPQIPRQHPPTETF